MLENLISAIVFGSVLTLFSVGLSLAWGTLDVLNLAHGAIFVLAGFAVYELTRDATVPLGVAAAIGILGAGAVTACLELIAFRQIRLRFPVKRQAELSFLIASVGAATIIETVIGNETGDIAFGPRPGAFPFHQFRLGGVLVSNIEIIIVVTALVVVTVLDIAIRRSRYGRAVRAIAYDPRTAGLLGVNVNALAAATMFLAGALAGLAGFLIATYVGSEDVSLGENYMLTSFSILIVGGVGSLRGAVVAAYGIAFLETAVVAYGPSQWENGVAFLLILLVLLVRPQGLFARAKFQRT